MLKQILKSIIPDAVREHLRPANRMEHGVAKGLLFDPGPSNHAYASGDNELPVQDFLAQHLKAGDTFYDVGANVGFLTVIGAHLVGPTGKVYAFEPVPGNMEVVRKNVSANGFEQVDLIEKAVSSQSGTGSLAMASYSGGAALTTAAAPPDVTEVVTVPLVSLDDCVSKHGLRPPQLVKIDVEGAEMDVFVGMQEMMRQHRPVILYEVDDQDRTAFDDKFQRYEDFLKQQGYRLERLADSYPNTNWLVGHGVAFPGEM